ARSTGQAAPQHQRNQAVSYRHSLNQNQRNGITQKASKPVGFSNPPRDRVLKNTVSGNVTINGTLMHYVQDDLPFGGVGDSGIGAYHGKEGFMALTHARGVYRQGRFNAATLLQPPFSKLTDVITSLILR
ncbi:aldehyde dehydrogenase family protein, partial [Komagataeibacter oboediens]|uniref:aldehyde dehydrogenase family protein n=1 Tax=Komagataeibacter oboediens TaxID=65958 RepID=UPI00241E43FC